MTKVPGEPYKLPEGYTTFFGREKATIGGEVPKGVTESENFKDKELIKVTITSQNVFVRLAASVWKRTGLKKLTNIKIPKNTQHLLMTRDKEGKVELRRFNLKKLNSEDQNIVQNELEKLMGEDALVDKEIVTRHLNHLKRAYEKVFQAPKDENSRKEFFEKHQPHLQRKIKQIKELENLINEVSEEAEELVEFAAEPSNAEKTKGLEKFSKSLSKINKKLKSLDGDYKNFVQKVAKSIEIEQGEKPQAVEEAGAAKADEGSKVDAQEEQYQEWQRGTRTGSSQKIFSTTDRTPEIQAEEKEAGPSPSAELLYVKSDLEKLIQKLGGGDAKDVALGFMESLNAGQVADGSLLNDIKRFIEEQNAQIVKPEAELVPSFQEAGANEEAKRINQANRAWVEHNLEPLGLLLDKVEQSALLHDLIGQGSAIVEKEEPASLSEIEKQNKQIKEFSEKVEVLQTELFQGLKNDISAWQKDHKSEEMSELFAIVKSQTKAKEKEKEKEKVSQYEVSQDLDLGKILELKNQFENLKVQHDEALIEKFTNLLKREGSRLKKIESEILEGATSTQEETLEIQEPIAPIHEVSKEAAQLTGETAKPSQAERPIRTAIDPAKIASYKARMKNFQNRLKEQGYTALADLIDPDKFEKELQAFTPVSKSQGYMGAEEYVKHARKYLSDPLHTYQKLQEAIQLEVLSVNQALEDCKDEEPVVKEFLQTLKQNVTLESNPLEEFLDARKALRDASLQNNPEVKKLQEEFRQINTVPYGEQKKKLNEINSGLGKIKKEIQAEEDKRRVEAERQELEAKRKEAINQITQDYQNLKKEAEELAFPKIVEQLGKKLEDISNQGAELKLRKENETLSEFSKKLEEFKEIIEELKIEPEDADSIALLDKWKEKQTLDGPTESNSLRGSISISQQVRQSKLSFEKEASSLEEELNKLENKVDAQKLREKFDQIKKENPIEAMAELQKLREELKAIQEITEKEKAAKPYLELLSRLTSAYGDLQAEATKSGYAGIASEIEGRLGEMQNQINEVETASSGEIKESVSRNQQNLASRENEVKTLKQKLELMEGAISRSMNQVSKDDGITPQRIVAWKKEQSIGETIQEKTIGEMVQGWTAEFKSNELSNKSRQRIEEKLKKIPDRKDLSKKFEELNASKKENLLEQFRHLEEEIDGAIKTNLQLTNQVVNPYLQNLKDAEGQLEGLSLQAKNLHLTALAGFLQANSQKLQEAKREIESAIPAAAEKIIEEKKAFLKEIKEANKQILKDLEEVRLLEKEFKEVNAWIESKHPEKEAIAARSQGEWNRRKNSVGPGNLSALGEYVQEMKTQKLSIELQQKLEEEEKWLSTIDDAFLKESLSRHIKKTQSIDDTEKANKAFESRFVVRAAVSQMISEIPESRSYDRLLKAAELTLSHAQEALKDSKKVGSQELLRELEEIDDLSATPQKVEAALAKVAEHFGKSKSSELSNALANLVAFKIFVEATEAQRTDALGSAKNSTLNAIPFEHTDLRDAVENLHHIFSPENQWEKGLKENQESWNEGFVLYQGILSSLEKASEAKTEWLKVVENGEKQASNIKRKPDQQLLRKTIEAQKQGVGTFNGPLGVDEVNAYRGKVEAATEAVQSAISKTLEPEKVRQEALESFNKFKEKIKEYKREVHSTVASEYGDQVDMSAIDELFDLAEKQLPIVFVGTGDDLEPMAISKSWVGRGSQQALSEQSKEELLKFKDRLNNEIEIQTAELEASILAPARELAKARARFDEAQQASLKDVNEKSPQVDEKTTKPKPQYLYAKRLSDSRISLMAEIGEMTRKPKVTNEDVKNLVETLQKNGSKLLDQLESYTAVSRLDQIKELEAIAGSEKEVEILRNQVMSKIEKRIEEHNQELSQVEEQLGALSSLVQTAPALRKLQADLKEQKEKIKSYQGSLPQGWFAKPIPVEKLNAEQLRQYKEEVEHALGSQKSREITKSLKTLPKLIEAKAAFDKTIRQVEESEIPENQLSIRKTLDSTEEQSQIQTALKKAQTVEQLKSAIKLLNQTTDRLNGALEESTGKSYDTLQQLVHLENQGIAEDDEVLTAVREKVIAETHSKIVKEEETCRALLANLAGLPLEVKQSSWYERNKEALDSLLSSFKEAKEDLPDVQSSEELKKYRENVEKLIRETSHSLSEEIPDSPAAEILRAIRSQETYQGRVDSWKGAFLSKFPEAKDEINGEIDNIKPALGIFEIEDIEKYYQSKTEQLETLLLIEELKLSEEPGLQLQIAERIKERISTYKEELKEASDKIEAFRKFAPRSPLLPSMDRELKARREEINQYDGVFPQGFFFKAKEVEKLTPKELKAYESKVNEVIKRGQEKLKPENLLLDDVLTALEQYTEGVNKIKEARFRDQFPTQISAARTLEMLLAEADADIQQQLNGAKSFHELPQSVTPRVRELDTHVQESYQESLKADSPNLQQLTELEEYGIGQGDQDYDAIANNFLDEMKPTFAEARRKASFLHESLEGLPAEIRQSEWFKEEGGRLLKFQNDLDKLESQQPEKMTAKTLTAYQKKVENRIKDEDLTTKNLETIAQAQRKYQDVVAEKRADLARHDLTQDKLNRLIKTHQEGLSKASTLTELTDYQAKAQEELNALKESRKAKEGEFAAQEPVRNATAEFFAEVDKKIAVLNEKTGEGLAKAPMEVVVKGAVESMQAYKAPRTVVEEGWLFRSRRRETAIENLNPKQLGAYRKQMELKFNEVMKKVEGFEQELAEIQELDNQRRELQNQILTRIEEAKGEQEFAQAASLQKKLDEDESRYRVVSDQTSESKSVKELTSNLAEWKAVGEESIESLTQLLEENKQVKNTTLYEQLELDPVSSEIRQAIEEETKEKIAKYSSKIKKAKSELENLPEDFPKEFFQSLFAAQEERLKKQIDLSKATLEEMQKQDSDFDKIDKMSDKAIMLFGQVAKFDEARRAMQDKIAALRKNAQLVYANEADQTLNEYQSLFREAEGLEKMEGIEEFTAQVEQAYEALKNQLEDIGSMERLELEAQIQSVLDTKSDQSEMVRELREKFIEESNKLIEERIEEFNKLQKDTIPNLPDSIDKSWLARLIYEEAQKLQKLTEKFTVKTGMFSREERPIDKLSLSQLLQHRNQIRQEVSPTAKGTLESQGIDLAEMDIQHQKLDKMNGKVNELKKADPPQFVKVARLERQLAIEKDEEAKLLKKEINNVPSLRQYARFLEKANERLEAILAERPMSLVDQVEKGNKEARELLIKQCEAKIEGLGQNPKDYRVTVQGIGFGVPDEQKTLYELSNLELIGLSQVLLGQ